MQQSGAANSRNVLILNRMQKNLHRVNFACQSACSCWLPSSRSNSVIPFIKVEAVFLARSSNRCRGTCSIMIFLFVCLKAGNKLVLIMHKTLCHVTCVIQTEKPIPNIDCEWYWEHFKIVECFLLKVMWLMSWLLVGVYVSTIKFPANKPC